MGILSISAELRCWDTYDVFHRLSRAPQPDGLSDLPIVFAVFPWDLLRSLNICKHSGNATIRKWNLWRHQAIAAKPTVTDLFAKASLQNQLDPSAIFLFCVYQGSNILMQMFNHAKEVVRNQLAVQLETCTKSWLAVSSLLYLKPTIWMISQITFNDFHLFGKSGLKPPESLQSL